MTRTEVRLAIQLLIPAVLGINHWLLNVGTETACFLTATWVYNDLKVCDDGWIQRNFMAALGSWIHNRGSLKVAIGGGGLSTAAITNIGDIWGLMTGGVIMTTMHIQDLKDMLGDKSRGRLTAPILFGEYITRWTLAIPIFLWGPLCALFWNVWIAAIPAMILGTYVAFRCVSLSGNMEEKLTWHVWCFWTAVLYFIPLFNHHQPWLLWW
jgi:hypothetical protein